jgi:hypothetical protein
MAGSITVDDGQSKTEIMLVNYKSVSIFSITIS